VLHQRPVSIRPRPLYDALDEEARRLIHRLPQQLLLTPPRTSRWPFSSTAQRHRRQAEALLDTDTAVLVPLAGHLAGHGLLEQRVTNLTAALGRLLTLRPGVAGDHSAPRHPTAVLASGSATTMERSLTLALLLRALGCQVGLLTTDQIPGELVPMIQTTQGWRVVEPPRQPASLTPLIPKRLDDANTLTLLYQPPNARQPHTVWNVLADYWASSATIGTAPCIDIR
jgi:hypothetical protein